MAKKRCKFFAQGRCLNGDDCKYSHNLTHSPSPSEDGMSSRSLSPVRGKRKVHQGAPMEFILPPGFAPRPEPGRFESFAALTDDETPLPSERRGRRRPAKSRSRSPPPTDHSNPFQIPVTKKSSESEESAPLPTPPPEVVPQLPPVHAIVFDEPKPPIPVDEEPLRSPSPAIKFSPNAFTLLATEDPFPEHELPAPRDWDAEEFGDSMLEDIQKAIDDEEPHVQHMPTTFTVNVPPAAAVVVDAPPADPEEEEPVGISWQHSVKHLGPVLTSVMTAEYEADDPQPEFEPPVETPSNPFSDIYCVPGSVAEEERPNTVSFDHDFVDVDLGRPERASVHHGCARCGKSSTDLVLPVSCNTAHLLCPDCLAKWTDFVAAIGGSESCPVCESENATAEDIEAMNAISRLGSGFFRGMAELEAAELDEMAPDARRTVHMTDPPATTVHYIDSYPDESEMFVGPPPDIGLSTGPLCSCSQCGQRREFVAQPAMCKAEHELCADCLEQWNDSEGKRAGTCPLCELQRRTELAELLEQERTTTVRATETEVEFDTKEGHVTEHTTKIEDLETGAVLTEVVTEIEKPKHALDAVESTPSMPQPVIYNASFLEAPQSGEVPVLACAKCHDTSDNLTIPRQCSKSHTICNGCLTFWNTSDNRGGHGTCPLCHARPVQTVARKPISWLTALAAVLLSIVLFGALPAAQYSARAPASIIRWAWTTMSGLLTMPRRLIGQA